MSSSDRVKIHCLHVLVLSEIAKNITWSFIVVDLTNFREPKFVNLNIKLIANKTTICLCGRNQFGVLCTWYLAKYFARQIAKFRLIRSETIAPLFITPQQHVMNFNVMINIDYLKY